MSFERCWDYAARVPKDLFNPNIEPKLLAQLSAFLFYPQVKIHFACS